MKNKDLIAALQQLDPEMEVAILDWRRNEIDGEDSAEGLYPEFEVGKQEWETSIGKKEEFAALTFYADVFVPASPRKCRVCGCTDDNCQQCVQKTGHPCHWVEQDLCSACADDPCVQNDTKKP